MKVIGITGTMGSGKDIVKDFFSKKFTNYYASISSPLRGEADKKKLAITRKLLQDMGDSLRQKYGNHILAKLAIEYLPRDRSIIIVDGIRNPGEVEWLRKTFKDNFILVSVDAPQQWRFERLQKRARKDDPKTFEEFVQLDERDQGKDQPPYGQQVKACMEMADFKINSGATEDLNSQLENIAKQI